MANGRFQETRDTRWAGAKVGGANRFFVCIVSFVRTMQRNNPLRRRILAVKTFQGSITSSIMRARDRIELRCPLSK